MRECFLSMNKKLNSVKVWMNQKIIGGLAARPTNGISRYILTKLGRKSLAPCNLLEASVESTQLFAPSKSTVSAHWFVSEELRVF